MARRSRPPLGSTTDDDRSTAEKGRSRPARGRREDPFRRGGVLRAERGIRIGHSRRRSPTPPLPRRRRSRPRRPPDGRGGGAPGHVDRRRDPAHRPQRPGTQLPGEAGMAPPGAEAAGGSPGRGPRSETRRGGRPAGEPRRPGDSRTGWRRHHIAGRRRRPQRAGAARPPRRGTAGDPHPLRGSRRPRNGLPVRPVHGLTPSEIVAVEIRREREAPKGLPFTIRSRIRCHPPAVVSVAALVSVAPVSAAPVSAGALVSVAPVSSGRPRVVAVPQSTPGSVVPGASSVPPQAATLTVKAAALSTASIFRFMIGPPFKGHDRVMTRLRAGYSRLGAMLNTPEGRTGRWVSYAVGPLPRRR